MTCQCFRSPARKQPSATHTKVPFDTPARCILQHSSRGQKCVMRSTFTAIPNLVAPRTSTCLRKTGHYQHFWRHGPGATYLGSRALQQEAFPADTIPFRKRLKDEAKQKRAAGQVVSRAARRVTTSKLEAWELTVGLEVHAQLNTERKLFSG